MTARSRNSSLAVLVVLLSAVLAAGFLLPRTGKGVSDSIRAAFLERDEAGRIIDIDIRTQKYSTSLVKREGTWLLARGGREYPVREGRIATLLQELTSTREFRKVADNAESWSSFGLDDTDAWVLGLEMAKRSDISPKGSARTGRVEIHFGFTDDTGDRVFVRRGGENASWRIDSGIFRLLGGKPEDWLDLSLFGRGAEGADLQSLDMFAGTGSTPAWSIVRNKDGWKFRSVPADFSHILRPGENPDSAAGRVIHAILSTKATGFANFDGGNPVDGEGKTVARLILHAGEGSSIRVELSRRPGSIALEAKMPGKQWVYLIDSEPLEGIVPPI